MSKTNEYLPRHPLGWKYDLAPPTEKPPQQLNSALLPPTPSKINNTYMEIPRSSVSIRGIASIGGSITLSSGLILYLYTILSTITEIGISEAKIIAIGLTITTAAYWAMIPFVRLDIELPRNEPTRFNRLRQKVYFYEYRFDRFYIFSRKKWGGYDP
ncbi:DUF6708 domain-containing protein [Pseudomonas mosselii]|uniref:DUF6708 domain-containing protein n=1 Tax=Pseudomonas mosselii TaxID=78327 RepID=UPI00283A9139|nr:DUF6708 domain-containing protein [Pseudomonas mosselii]